ncbi:MAG TPA: pitrilysin family protein [Pyrinomonadaceae bacterium]|nr:pitrilysin family protein [Pyrinomonadaceae bacterium]
MQRSLRGLTALFVLFVSCVGGSYAQSDAEKQITEYDVNGLKVIVKRRPGTPTVAAGLFIRGGVKALTPQNAGIENFMLDVSTEGGKQFPRDVLRKELNSTGTTLNTSAANDYSVLALTCTKANFDRAWKLFTDVSLQPAFAADDVERVRSNILQSIAAKSDTPDSALPELVERTVFAGHPYSLGTDGTAENVTRFKAADLAAWHKQVFQTSRLLLVVVGDVDPATVQKLAAASFGSLPRGGYKEAPMPAIDFSKSTLDVERRGIPTDYVQGVFAAPSISDPDFYAMRVASTILQTKVYQEVRVKRNLSYAPDAGMGESAANTGFIYVTSTDPNQSVRVMLDSIRDLRTNEVSDDVIREYGSFFLTTYYLGQETNAAQAGTLARYELIGGGWRNSLQFIDRIRRVTPAEVKAAAQKYMKNVRFVVVGEPTHIDRSVFLQAL